MTSMFSCKRVALWLAIRHLPRKYVRLAIRHMAAQEYGAPSTTDLRYVARHLMLKNLYDYLMAMLCALRALSSKHQMLVTPI